MEIYGLCPVCGQKTKINNLEADYLMCGSCYEIYGIAGSDATITGGRLSKELKSQLVDEIEQIANKKISNWRNV